MNRVEFEKELEKILVKPAYSAPTNKKYHAVGVNTTEQKVQEIIELIESSWPPEEVER